MLPPDRVQCTAGVGNEDGFVPDVAVVARAVAPQHRENLAARAAAGQRNHGALGCFRIPCLHGAHQIGRGAIRNAQMSTNLPHGVVAGRLTGIPVLRCLEIVEHEKQRQQA